MARRRRARRAGRARLGQRPQVRRPEGVGVLVARRGHAVRAQLLGGGQERERRSGTPNVAGAVALATAARSAADERKALVDRVGGAARPPRRRHRRGGPGTHEWAVRAPPGPASDRSTRWPASRTSASPASRARRCCSCSTTPASRPRPRRRVPAARSIPPTSWRPWASTAAGPGSLRLSLGWSTTEADIDAALAAMPAAVARLRSLRVSGVAACWWPCRAGSTRRSRRAAARRGPRGRRRHPEAVGRRTDTGCCSVSDVDDARRVADQLGIDHHTFNFGDDFDRASWPPTWPRTPRASRPTRASPATAT